MKRMSFSHTLLAIVAIAAISAAYLRDRGDIVAQATTRVNNLEITGTTDATGVVTARAGVRLTTPTTGPIFISGSGSPNGAVTATQGSLYLRTDTAQVYQNTDGVQAWTQLGTGGSTTFSGASVYHAAGTINVLGNSARSLFPQDTEVYDTDNYHSNVTNNSRLTVPTTGYYLIKAQARFQVNATGFREIAIEKNANGTPGAGTVVAFIRLNNQGAAAATLGEIMLSGVVVQLNAGDYIEMFVGQDSGSTLTCQNLINETFQISRLGS